MTVEVRLSANRHKDRFKYIMSLERKDTVQRNFFSKKIYFQDSFLKLPIFMQRSAVFSKCRTYRYLLSRVWDETSPRVMFVGLNPSTADENTDDPTIRRCINFAKSWGFGGMSIVNLFAFCSHDPKKLEKIKDPIGPKNDILLKKHISKHEKVVLIWGNKGDYLKRNEQVLKLIKKPLCLKINKNGAPGHPLYLKSTLKPIPFKAQ